MTIRKALFLVLCAVGATTSAFAQDSNAGRSETQAKAEEGKYRVGVTNWAIRPEAGGIFYNGNQRFTAGVMTDFNLLGISWMKIGPSFGALYSSLSGANFFDGVSTSNNDYVFQIPANLKLTGSPDPQKRLQLGVHGGANIIRSTGTTVAVNGGAFGAGPSNTTNLGTTSTGASWDVHPNIGGDIDFALGTNADLTLRPDVTFMSAYNLVTATIGLGLKL